MPWFKRLFYRRLTFHAVMQPGDIYYDEEAKTWKTIRHTNEEPSGWKVFNSTVYRLRGRPQWRRWNVKKP